MNTNPHIYNNKRIALLIDADNTSPSYLDLIMNELSSIGSVDIKRAYGDFTSRHLNLGTEMY